MKTNLLKRGLAVVLAGVLAVTTVNVNIRADEATEITAEEKYADIIGLYKTVDETIEMLIERADKDDLEERTYFVKSEDKELDTSWWSNIVDKRSGEDIYLYISKKNSDASTFKVGDYYYHTFSVGITRAYTTSEDKKEYEEKVKYVEETLGLFSEEMCDYEKAAIIFKYIVDNVEYGGYATSIYSGQTAYEALINNKAVCAGYSRLYSSMLEDVGIRNLWITSNECSNPHAWNLVEIGDKWYYCDPTYSDPINSNTITSNDEGYMWFYNFMQGSLDDAESPYHEVDTNSNKGIDYFNCVISEENLDSDSSIHDAFCRIVNYTAPTCTEVGVFELECEYCNSSHAITIPITHYYTYTTTIEPTCLEEGSGIAICKLCGDAYEYTIPARGHKWTYAQQTMDCETDGYEKVYCKECGEVYWGEETPACGHNWTEWVDASIMQYMRNCLNCENVQYEYKSVIDGVEEPTTDSSVSEADKTPMDRGYGVIAYYDETTKGWIYYDTIWESYLPAFEGTDIWSEELGENVYWDEATHTFITFEEYLAKLGQGSETGTTTSDNPAVTTNPTGEAATSGNSVNGDEIESITEKVETTTEKTETTTSPKTTTTVTATTTTKIKAKIKAPTKAVIKTVKSKKKSAKKVKLTLKKIKGVVGYEIAIYSKKKNAKNNKKALYVKRVKKAKPTIKSKKLANRKKLYVRARAYVFDTSGSRVYGKWSKVINVKIKK